jgi:hypothetical protein
VTRTFHFLRSALLRPRVDVTKAIQAKKTQLVLSGYTGGSGSVSIYNQNAPSSARPVLSLTLGLVPAQEVSVSIPPMNMSGLTRNPVVSVTAETVNSVPAADTTLTAVDPVVAVAGNVSMTVPVISVGSVEFIGGDAANPDALGVAQAMTLSLTAPSAIQFIEYNAISVVPAINVGSMDVNPVAINLTTNRLSVAPAMKVTLRWPGIYIEAADRYLTLLNNRLKSANDVWYKLGGENSGATRITDTAQSGLGMARMDGYVFGNPDFNLPDGPKLRRAARFDGIDDYIVAGPYSNNGLYNNTQDIQGYQHAVTIEFSIRTTQLNGTIFNGTGGGNGGLAAISPTYYALPNIVNRLNLKNGYLNPVDGVIGASLVARSGFIADGEWHHIVMALPAGKEPRVDPAKYAGPSYLMVDGNIVMQTYGLAGGEFWAPYAFMADADVQYTAYENGGGGSGNGGPRPAVGKNVKNYLAGDLRDVIIRLDTYQTMQASNDAYYEWSDSVILPVQPMTVNLAGVAPFRARGNAKRMLAIYGLPTGYNGLTGMFTGGEPMNTYQSKWSGFILKSFENGLYKKLGYATEDRYGWERTDNRGGWTWREPAVFEIGGFYVYPVSITGSGVPSHPGLINPDAEMDTNGTFVDYETGQPRYIDLQNDLMEPVSNFDAITCINYPWVSEDGYEIPQTGNNNPNTAPAEGPEFGMYQTSYRMNDAKWKWARDNLRDSILDAVYNGVNLWIGEWHMALHLGFIGGVDFHDSGMWYSGGFRENKNFAAQELDMSNLRDDKAKEQAGWVRGGNGYFSYPQSNIFRRVVAEVEGLTDQPSVDVVAMVEGWHKNEWQPNGSFLAYMIEERPNGLKVGDRQFMNVMFRWDTKFGTQTESQLMTQFAPSKRIGMVSARPDGIVGRVVTREIDRYSIEGQDDKGHGLSIVNPHKDNAYTIAVERGSVVRGRPTRGRVFIELMEDGVNNYGAASDLDKRKWNGDIDHGDEFPSKWSFDTRRYKETKIIQTSYSWRMNSDSGVMEQIAKTWNYFDYEDGTYKQYNQQPTWHERGLRWLALTPDVDGDSYVAYALPMTIDLTTPAPAHSNSKNPVSQVFGGMRLDLEVRQPFNYKDGTVVERTLPMEMTLELRGLGRLVVVPPMVVAVQPVTPTVHADTEIINVYLDNSDAVTLFIKEEN